MNLPQEVARYVLLSLCGIMISFGEEPKIDPFSLDDLDTGVPEVPLNPNHLEPIPAYDPAGYDQAVFRSLIRDDPGDLWMIGRPSFGPEYAVVLRREIEYEGNPIDGKIKSERCVVESVEAVSQIWRWKELEGGEIKLDIQVTKDIRTHRAEVPKEFAAWISEAWKSVLKTTRYVDEEYRGLDGANYQFYCLPQLFGEIWSPNSGIPLKITLLGHKLGEIPKANEKDRETLVRECLSAAKELATLASGLE